MKSLVESLFDNNLVTNKLSIEKYMDDFSSYALEKLDPQERNSVFDQLFESGTVCNADQLRKNPVDLTKNIIIQRRDGLKGLTDINYPCKYTFIYQLVMPLKSSESDLRTFEATLQDYRDGKSYCWKTNSLDGVDKKPTWKGKVAAFYTPNCSYSVITNKEWVKNIIDGILLD